MILSSMNKRAKHFTRHMRYLRSLAHILNSFIEPAYGVWVDASGSIMRTYMELSASPELFIAIMNFLSISIFKIIMNFFLVYVLNMCYIPLNRKFNLKQLLLLYRIVRTLSKQILVVTYLTILAKLKLVEHASVIYQWTRNVIWNKVSAWQKF